MSPASPAVLEPSGTIPSLDGIRALAVGLVFFAHSGLERLVPGGLGVTIFFVLSGYLISTLMRVEQARAGRISFRGFYLRRLLRLMPPLAIVVVLAGTLAALGVIDGGFSAGGALAALFYGGNYHMIANDFHGMPAGLGVVWSLAIEEHYYLFYPPVAVLLVHLGSVRRRVALLAALCAAVLAWRCWLLTHGASVDYLTMATDTRVDAILVGCLLAFARNPWLDPLPPRRARDDAALAFGAFALLAATLLWRDEVFRFTARFTLQSVAIAALLWLAVARADRQPFRWLALRPMVYLGSISYTVYLSHHLILLGLARHWPQWSWLQLTLAGAALTLAVAEPMRRWVEQPCALWRRRLHRATLAHEPVPEFRFVGTP
jgi:peptidoglycan/LPS O-acetylase OafA/YrhL